LTLILFLGLPLQELSNPWSRYFEFAHKPPYKRHSLPLHERVARLLGKAEEYQKIDAVAPIVVDFVLPSTKNPKIIVLCRSVTDSIKASKEERMTPEEMTIRTLNDISRQIKQAKPGVKTISIFSDYDKDRFSPDEATEIADYTDLIVINEEITDLPKIIRGLSK